MKTMYGEENYREVNRALWNEKTPWHVRSDMYDLPSFKAGRSSLTEIELKMLGDVKGKSILHLQCHFGQDTLSLARMGANVTGVDLSDKAIEQAKLLAEELELNTRFICSDVYALKEQLDEKFDIVFTSFGVIGWLPDMDRWAGIISHFLKPGGRLVFAEFHPVVWMFDTEFNEIAYSYFKSEPIVEEEAGTYANREADMISKSVTWNHSLGEVISAVLKQGLQLTFFEEYNYSPFNIFGEMEAIGEKQYVRKKDSGKLPLVYALMAQK